MPDRGRVGGPAELRFTDEPAGFERELLALDAAAAASYYGFVFPDPASAREHVERLFAAGVADCSPPLCRLALDDAGLAGMYCAGSGAAWRKRRLAAAVATMRDRARPSPLLHDRARSAADALLRLQDSDWYLSRIAVADDCRGRGIGRVLLDRYVAEGRALGLRRCVLEVDPANEAAIALYRQAGFVEEGELRVRDEAVHAQLAYLHMTMALR